MNINSTSQHRFLKSLMLLAISTLTSQAIAQPPAVSDTENQISLWSTILSGGIIGFLIILTSIAALALIIDSFLRIKRNKIIPQEHMKHIEKLIKSKKYNDAKDYCSRQASFTTEVIHSGLSKHDSVLGFYDMQNAMQETSERYISKLLRKIDYLAFIGSTAPMLGLLGTVTGMIKSFNQIALTQGSTKAGQLAGGISEALITTCLGLIVAIPTMFFVTFFKNRIEEFIAEAEPLIDNIMNDFRNK